MTQLSHRTLAIHNRQLAFRWLSACLVLIAASSIAVAQAGQLDRSFASKGILLENFDGSTRTGRAGGLQSDGKIVAAGTMGNPNSTQSSGVVIRLNTNDTFDSSFGTAGIVSIMFGEVNDSPGMGIQSV